MSSRWLHTHLVCFLVAVIATTFGEGNKRYEAFIGCETWHGAIASCRNKGGQLAIIGDESVDRQVQLFITNRGITHWGFWISAHDLSAEGYWTSHTGDPLTYHNWDDNEPDNDPHSTSGCGGVEDCAVMWPSHQYKWNDAICLKRFGYICEFDDNLNGDNLKTTEAAHVSSEERNVSTSTIGRQFISPTTRTSTVAAIQYVIPRNMESTKTTQTAEKSVSKRYEILPACATWYDAIAACDDLGGRLASIPDNKTQHELELLKTMNGFGHLNLWFNAHDVVEEGQWITSNGDRQTYFNWASGQPDNAAYSNTRCRGIEDCALMGPKRQRHRWKDSICIKRYGYICEFDVIDTKIVTAAGGGIQNPGITCNITTTTQSAEETEYIQTTQNHLSSKSNPTSTNGPIPTMTKSVPSDVVPKSKDESIGAKAPKTSMLHSPIEAKSSDNYVMVTFELVISSINLLLLLAVVVFQYFYVWRKTQPNGLREPFYQDFDKKGLHEEINSTNV
ncbi:uncharacterized protein LOC144436675 [Glandiceps talaboti]